MRKMKNVIPGILMTMVAANCSAQVVEASANSSLPKLITKVDAPPVPVQGKEVVIAFRNTCERPVGIFAGPKEGIREPKITTFGGLSNYQKLYLHENDVVCLMKLDKQPSACTVIKPGVTSVEVNSSATAIAGKQ